MAKKFGILTPYYMEVGNEYQTSWRLLLYNALREKTSRHGGIVIWVIYSKTSLWDNMQMDKQRREKSV
jgi:hypothetical protein